MSQFEQENVNTQKGRVVHLVTTIAVAKALCLPMRLAEDFVATLTQVGVLAGQPAFDRADMEYRRKELLGDTRDWPTLGRIAIALKIRPSVLSSALSTVGLLGSTNREMRLPGATVGLLLEHLASEGKLPASCDFDSLLFAAREMLGKRGAGKTDLSRAELATALRLTRAPAILRGRRAFIVFYDRSKCLDLIFDFYVARTEQDSSWVSFDHLMESKKVTGKELVEIARRVTKRNVGITHLVSPAQFALIKQAVDSWTAKRSTNAIKTH